MYTLDYTFDQLLRLHSYIDSGQRIRIIHLLTDDTVNHTMEDHYIVLVDCSPAQYTMLLML